MHNSNLYFVKKVFVFCLICFWPFLLWAETPKTNIVWIKENSRYVLQNSLSRYLNNASPKLTFFNISTEHQNLLKSLFATKINAEQQNPKQQGNAHRIHIEHYKTEIVYKQSSVGFLSLFTHTTRFNNVQIKGWVENYEGQILHAFNLNETMQNNIKDADIEALEESPYSFSKGKMESASVWNRIIEPAFATIGIAAITYLFYSQRS